MDTSTIANRFAVQTARCSRAQGERLIGYDHHYVWINGRAGVVLTYDWMQMDVLHDTLVLHVVFADSAQRHPAAPPDIQAIIDGLSFVHVS